MPHNSDPYESLTNAPAGTRDYVYPALIQEKENEALQKAQDSASGDITNPIARDTIPSIDFDVGADVSAVSGNEWAVNTADGVSAGDQIEVFNIDSDTGNAEKRVNVIYGFEVLQNVSDSANGTQDDVGVDKVIFKGSDDQVFERAVVSGLDADGDNPVDRQELLRSPIAVGPQENVTIEYVLSEAASAGTESLTVDLELLSVTAEKEGRRVGTRNN